MTNSHNACSSEAHQMLILWLPSSPSTASTASPKQHDGSPPDDNPKPCEKQPGTTPSKPNSTTNNVGINNGHRWRTIKHDFQARCRATNAPCHICHQPINWNAPPQHPEAFEPDHYYPRKTHPHLAYDPGNLRPSHSRCNRTRGDTPMPPPTWTKATGW